MYDIVGDIHGYCSKLRELLGKLGYVDTEGIFKHHERKAIFVGDYIDRGPEIRETLQLIRGMVEAGSAFAIMGNHEYNAIAYNTQLPNGTHLREHNATHQHQHQATLEQFANFPDEWNEYLQWFGRLPLFLELEGLRAVHACWDAEHIQWLKSNNHHTLNNELLFQSHIRGSHAYEVINDTLKGKEFNVPEKYAWSDKDGHSRTSNRVKWWVQTKETKLGNFLFNCPPALQEENLSPEIKINIYPEKDPPVFFGHYWLEDKYPVIQAENVICLDYSVAKEGLLVAYRWNGEEKIDNKHFVFVDPVPPGNGKV